ncbi:hypothetical protein [Undibacterium luofuense]|uniref:Uncharacterized protein n=1 Tax=Undibacterium luofuense TaxID=2828733 RepID=A0A941I7J7_9BURK|nr:hypothetical protein [Undibacterium luofuense]MBR7782740.1 hypothetical protein [Undibacterium luofuense]
MKRITASLALQRWLFFVFVLFLFCFCFALSFVFTLPALPRFCVSGTGGYGLAGAACPSIELACRPLKMPENG